MQALLPVFSFLAILLLALIIPGQVKSHSIPAVSIISWLFVCNIIHAANSIVWADNIGVHAPVWCDISTKILLGAMVAVPGALFCISRQLEVLTSRYEHTKKPSARSKLIIDSIMCIVNPLLYMSLHTIVQFRRFSILENLGCQPAVHDSLPGVVLVWLPPFIISSVAFLYNCSAAFNLTKSHYNNVEYFPTAPDMQLSLFLRRLVFATIAVLYTAAAYAIVLSWSSDNLLPWTTISQVHANFAQVEIIQLDTRLATKSELIWWSIPAWTFLLCALSAFGEETKKGYRRIWAWASGRSKKAILPTARPKRPQVLIPQANISHLDLRSPWESTVRSDRTIKLKGSDSITSLSPTFSEDENSFTKSTLNYLDSDAARQLRLPSPPPETALHYRNQTFSLPGSSSPPRMSPTQSSATRASSARASPPPQTPPPRTPPPRTPPPQAPSIEFRPVDPVDPEIMSTVREPIPRSRTSSILSTSAWPKPPPSPPSMHPYALSIPLQEQQQQRQPPLRALSPAPSFSSGDVPFQGPSILDAPSGMPRRMVSTKSAKGKSRAGPSPIQLTVMRETLVDS